MLLQIQAPLTVQKMVNIGSGGSRVLREREAGTGHPMATAAPELDPTADDPTNSKFFFYKRDVIQANK